MTPIDSIDTTPQTAIVPHDSRWQRNMDRLSAILDHASDDQVIEILSVVTGAAKSRRDRVMEEAQARLAKFESILPTPGRIAPERREDPTPLKPAPVQTPSHEVSPTPKGLQCPAIDPSDVTIKCTQPRAHEGMHYNHATRKRWERRVT